MKAGLFSRTGVRYEVAVDLIGAIIAHHAEQIAIEEDKAEPSATAISEAEQAMSELRTLREGLDAADSKAIEDIIVRYGPKARALYQTV